MNADRPISRPEDDDLGRGALVSQLAKWVRAAPLVDGFVIGVTGAWGVGKTSVLELLAREFEEDAIVVRFDPWLFADADQLVVRFFEELSATLSGEDRKRLRKLGQRVASYGSMLAPIATVALGPAGEILGAPDRLLDGRRRSVLNEREELKRALLKAERRILVLIDDIDRLEPREINEVLRLVKLVADLPGVVHVLGYARERVATSLEALGHDDGNAYLEKIVQASIAVPPVSRDRLRRMWLDWLQDALGDRGLESWQEDAWTSLVNEGIDSYFSTLRDGRRFANTAPSAIDLCTDEVAGMDVLALEAIRVFDPAAHESLSDIADVLTGSGEFWDMFRSREDRDNEARQRLEAIELASARWPITRPILLRLFPAAGHLLGGSRHVDNGEWHRTKRVASSPVLHRYLHLSLATGEVASAAVDAGVDALGDPNRFQDVLAGVADADLDNFIARVRARVREQSAPNVAGCARVLLRGLASRPPIPRGLDVGVNRRGMWLIQDLVASLPSTTDAADTALRIIREAPDLSWRIELLYRFRTPPEGPSQSPESDLLAPETFTTELDAFVDEVERTPPDVLGQERFALWIVREVGDRRGKAAALGLLRHDEILLGVLTHVGTEVRPSDGSPRVVLNISPLIDIAGGDVIPALAAIRDSPTIEIGLRDALDGALAARGDEDSPPIDSEASDGE
jgi:hypothetical protein